MNQVLYCRKYDTNVATVNLKHNISKQPMPTTTQSHKRSITGHSHKRSKTINK